MYVNIIMNITYNKYSFIEYREMLCMETPLHSGVCLKKGWTDDCVWSGKSPLMKGVHLWRLSVILLRYCCIESFV